MVAPDDWLGQGLQKQMMDANGGRDQHPLTMHVIVSGFHESPLSYDHRPRADDLVAMGHLATQRRADERPRADDARQRGERGIQATMTSNAPSRSGVDGNAVVLAPIARDDAPILANLCELYAHDFSEFVPLSIKPSGRFEFAIDERWWADADHFPFFIKVDGQLSGFALARRGSRVVTEDHGVMDVAEFFVLRGVRERRVGMRAAHALFARFPAGWEVRVRLANAPANAFWARVFDSWRSGSITTARHSAQGVEWNVLRMAPRPP